MTAPSIILVEDDPPLRTLTARALQEHGYQVRPASSGPEMWVAFDAGPVDLVVLDVMLPGTNGIDLCRQIRRKSDVPIIFISARGSETDRIVGLELGADDYLPKPFGTRELIARIRAVLRRIRPGLADDRLNHGDIIIDRVSHRVKRSGQEVHLGPTEFRLLDHFMQHPGRVFSREQLLDAVWGSDVYVEARTVDVHVGRLRKALAIGDDSANPIRTVRSAGYSLDLEG